MKPHVEAYLYSDGTAGMAVDASFTVQEAGAPIAVQLAAPAVFSDALTQFAATLNGLHPTGHYSLTYDSTAKRVTIDSAGTTFTFTPAEGLGRLLGFRFGPYSGQTSYTGELAPEGRTELLALAIQPPESADQVDLQRIRHGRSLNRVWGNAARVSLTMWMQTGGIGISPSPYIRTGRIRLYPGANTNPYDATLNLDGYTDGFVVEESRPVTRGSSDEYVGIPLLLAVPR